MRRSRLVQILGGTVMAAALLLPSSALASTVAPAAGATAPATTAVAPMKLKCSFVVQNVLGPAAMRRVNVCTWEAPAGVTVSTYRLWRVVNAPNPPSRIMIAAIAAAEPLRYTDAAIRSGHSYTYYVAGIGADGKRVALSNRVTIHVGRAIQRIGMACSLATVGNLSGVACHWSRATRPAASRYVLVRSVDAAARQRLYNTWIHGKRSFLDTDVKPGQTIRYAVLVLSPSGRVVGRGGPVVVTIPAASAPTN
jgi:hypothetical protein